MIFKMNQMNQSHHQEKFEPKKLRILYSMGFLLAVATALLAYIRSSYIGEFIETKYLGLVFILANLIAFIVIDFFPRIIKKYGRFKTLFVLLWLKMIILFFLVFFYKSWLGLIIFIFYLTILWLVWAGHDIFVEMYSRDILTGRIRGLEYTIINLGWLVSPFLAGWLLQHYGFSWVFLLVGALMLPVILLFRFNFSEEPLRDHITYKFWPTLKEIYSRAPIFKIFCIGFLLNFFYCWMVIYTPLYLRSLGISWSEIGFIFTIMLLPFVLLQYPAGWLADKFLGEKELLSFGFIIMGLTTFTLFFIKTPAIFIWAILLFTTRVGASLIEIMKDSYFFKQIDQRNINLIILYRNLLPLAYVIAPLIAVFILIFLPLQYLFLFLGLFMLSGLAFSLRLRDTR
jgi:MFS family permease